MKRWMVATVVAAAGAAVIGNVVWRDLRGREVSSATVGNSRVVAAVYATGRVDTDRRATVRARVAAPLAELNVGAGERVEAGRLIGRQDATSLRLAAERAERDVEAAEAALAEAEDTARRAEQLATSGLLPDDQLVQARERRNQLRAERAAARAALGLAREQAGWIELRSPLAGVVSTLDHRAGDVLQDGDAVLTVVDLAPAYLRVAVDERDVGRVAPGQSVRLVFDAFPRSTFTGTVWRIVPAVDRLTKSADVLVELPKERPPLQLDQTVTVNIVTDVVEGATVVPRDALSGTGDDRAVFMVDGSGRATRRGIRVGFCDERQCQVTAGLSPGDTVISPLPADLEPGERVHRR